MEGLNEQQRAAADAAFATRLNVVHHAYVDIAGDLIAGALLGQVLYWFAPGKDGRSRARIVKEGRLWIAKTRADWWDEIRISPKQYDRGAPWDALEIFVEVIAFNQYTEARLQAGELEPRFIPTGGAWFEREGLDG